MLISNKNQLMTYRYKDSASIILFVKIDQTRKLIRLNYTVDVMFHNMDIQFSFFKHRNTTLFKS